MLHVVTVNYNNVAGLRKTVESYNRLTGLDVKFYIIDGGSSDGFAEFIRGCSSFDLTVVSEADRGTYDAMNKAIDMVYDRIELFPSNYMIFMNSGDEFYNLTESTLAKCADYPLVAGKNRTDSGWTDVRRDLGWLYWGVMPFCHQSLIYNCNLIDQSDLKFSLQSWSYNDFRQVVELSRKYRPVEYIDDVVATYEQVTSTGISRSSWKYRLEKVSIMYSLFGLLGLIRMAIAKTVLNEFRVR